MSHGRTDGRPGLIIVGYGGVVRKVHAPQLRAGVGFRVEAIVEPHPPNAEAAGSAWSGVPITATLAEARDAAPDAVAALIATPPASHARLTLEAAALGLHTYTEKPLAVEPDDLAMLQRLADAPQRVHAVGFNYRFHPNLIRLRRLLEQEQLGQPRTVQTLFCSPAGKQQADWKTRQKAGGGVVLDLLSHHFDLLSCLFGPPEVVSAETRSIRSEEDTVAARLRWRGGLLAQSSAALHASEVDRVTVVGDHGTFTHDRFHAGRTSLEPTRRRYGFGDRGRAAASMLRQSGARGRELLRPKREPSHAAALQAFAAAVGGTPSPLLAGLEAGLLNSRLLLAARRSSRDAGIWQAPL